MAPRRSLRRRRGASSVSLRERARPPSRVPLPEPLHHELQVRRLDALVAGVGAGAGRRRLASSANRPVRTLIEDGVDELRLEVHGRVAGDAARCTRRPAGDRFGAACAIEVVDPQVVAEQVRDRALEAVELDQRVLAERDQDVDAQVARR